MWNSITFFIRSKLNTYTSFINTPPVVFAHDPKDSTAGATPAAPNSRRRVLLIHCHPVSDSYSTAISHVVSAALIKSQHEVRLRRLYFHGNKNECYGGKTFDCALTSEERVGYHNERNNRLRENEQGMKLVSSPEIQEAVKDLRWCDSIVFIYPTWWFDFPAVLKGYFDRVFLPGVAFQLPSKHTHTPTDDAASSSSSIRSSKKTESGLLPGLTNITKIGVVTTHGATFPVTCYVGKCGDCLFVDLSYYIYILCLLF
jgi:putative NADPH-quinone reductase